MRITLHNVYDCSHTIMAEGSCWNTDWRPPGLKYLRHGFLLKKQADTQSKQTKIWDHDFSPIIFCQAALAFLKSIWVF